MDALKRNINKLTKEIAQHREDLVTAQSLLKDDELYLKDLTARCEDRANDYDQRSAMRGAELDALKGALKVLRGKVKDRADDVNERALLIQKGKVVPAIIAAPQSSMKDAKPVSFLQELSASLRGSASLSQEER